MKASSAEPMGSEGNQTGGPPLERRGCPRFAFASSVMIEDYWAERHFIGKMNDYSCGGMSFETCEIPGIGIEVFIGMNKSPYSPAHDVFRGRVVWVRKLAKGPSHFPYAVGVKYC